MHMLVECQSRMSLCTSECGKFLNYGAGHSGPGSRLALRERGGKLMAYLL